MYRDTIYFAYFLFQVLVYFNGKISSIKHIVMLSIWHKITFRLISPLWGKPPVTMQNFVFAVLLEQSVEQTDELSLIWHASTLPWSQCSVLCAVVNLWNFNIYVYNIESFGDGKFVCKKRLMIWAITFQCHIYLNEHMVYVFTARLDDRGLCWQKQVSRAVVNYFIP